MMDVSSIFGNVFSGSVAPSRPFLRGALAASVVAGALAAVGCNPGAAPEVASPENDRDRPNVVMIVTDDQGYADYSAFDHHAPDVDTPNMDRIAEEGMLFTQAYATAPVCSPSRAGLMTGRYQFRWDEGAGWNPGLPDSVKTLAERLSQAGYATARFGKSDYGDGYHRFAAREYPLNHGYERFLGFSAHAQDYGLLSEEIAERTPDPDGNSANLGPLMQGESNRKSYEDGYTTDIFTDAAIDYVERRAGKERPFFLTLSYNAVHHLVHEVPPSYLEAYDVEPIPPYDPARGESFEGEEAGSYKAYYEKYSRLGAITSEQMRQYYLANLSYLDDSIGRFLDALRAKGLAENTLLVFVSDHGGSPVAGASNAPLTAGKYSLYEGGIRVPFAMRWPAGGLEGGAVHERPVSTLDVAPTALAAAGARAPSEEAFDGVNLLPRLRGDAPAAGEKPRTLFWRWQGTFAVRQGDWKLTNVGEPQYKSRPSDYYIEPKYDTQKVRLFNLGEDSEEAVNVADEHPQVARRLMNRYEEWMRVEAGRY